MSECKLELSLDRLLRLFLWNDALSVVLAAGAKAAGLPLGPLGPFPTRSFGTPSGAWDVGREARPAALAVLDVSRTGLQEVQDLPSSLRVLKADGNGACALTPCDLIDPTALPH